jgi:hypothetical protein
LGFALSLTDGCRTNPSAGGGSTTTGSGSGGFSISMFFGIALQYRLCAYFNPRSISYFPQLGQLIFSVCVFSSSCPSRGCCSSIFPSNSLNGFSSMSVFDFGASSMSWITPSLIESNSGAHHH